MGKKVYVNGKETDLEFRRCTRCPQDTTVPGITFDKDGVCNFCRLHDKMDKIFPAGEEGKRILRKMFQRMRKDGRGKKYDCIVGISGGRDSIYLLYKVVQEWGLRPLAVHFNDGFDNPVAGENMVKACRRLNVELRTITSDWREAKDLKISFLKASVPDLNMGTDVAIGSSLYGVAHKEGIKHIMIGQSFRTEGIKPLSWSFLDGEYLKNVQKEFGNVKLKPWEPNNPGFNLGIRELFYYTIIRRIKIFFPMYHVDYVRKDAEEILKKELDWVYPGAHYFDDLYHSLIKYVTRMKFKFDDNLNSDAALVRTGQLSREKAIERAHSVYHIEDPKIIDLCIKRLGLTKEEFNQYMERPPKTFRDYKTSWPYIKALRIPIWMMSRLHLLPKVTHDKYFNCGD
ncbi:MAG: N-acetyl sugar amidotransferase [Candidatus Woesearchaeota archaeon]